MLNDFNSHKYLTNFPILQDMVSHPIANKLNGSEGTNRAEKNKCEINAINDFEAIQIWLNEYKAKETTHRLYQKEAERLLLWSIFHLQKPFSSMNREDIDKYLSFLKDPTPKNVWCAQRGGRGRKRGEPAWRPFEGPLGESSIKTAITVIASLFSYLEEARYLEFNPMRLMRKKLKRQQVTFEEQKINLQERILELDEWQAMLKTLNELPEDKPHEKDEKQRLKLIVSMLFFLGLRINELVTHNWNSFRMIQGNWWFMVRGKGEKLGKIPVNNELLNIIQEYRKSILLRDDLPQPDETNPIVVSWRTGDALTTRYINHLLKVLANQTAKNFPNDKEKQKKLSRFSAHWLRHLSATMQERAGIPESHIMANMRHENMATTKLYIHENERNRHQVMQLLKLSKKKQ